jgi:hypothetical protein
VQDEKRGNELTGKSGYGDIANRFPADPAGDEDGDGGEQRDNHHQNRKMFNGT